jgi:flavin reductase (DIM6/NTAB) family NADH-FMN oxidoreductase RutF
MELRKGESYKLLVRPCVIITTISPKGIGNAAPFSFNMPLSFSPPLYGFACCSQHDTWRNIRRTKEWVVNVISEKLGNILHILEKDWPYEVNEAEKAGLKELPSKRVKPKRLADAVAWIECKFHKAFKTGDHVFIVGEVVCAEVNNKFWDEEKCTLDLKKAKLLCHLGGENFVIGEKIKQFKRAP